MVYAWRLAANGLERVGLARTSARGDVINKHVPCSSDSALVNVSSAAPMSGQELISAGTP